VRGSNTGLYYKELDEVITQDRYSQISNQPSIPELIMTNSKSGVKIPSDLRNHRVSSSYDQSKRLQNHPIAKPLERSSLNPTASSETLRYKRLYEDSIMENSILKKEIQILKLKNKLMSQDLKRLEIDLQISSQQNETERNGEYTGTRVKNSFASAWQRLCPIGASLVSPSTPSLSSSLQSVVSSTSSTLALRSYSISLREGFLQLGELEGWRERGEQLWEVGEGEERNECVRDICNQEQVIDSKLKKDRVICNG